MNWRRSCVLTAIVLVAASIVVPALAGERASRPSLRVRPAVVASGARVWVAGNADGCPRGDTVLVLSRAFDGQRFAGVPAIRARVRAGGKFSAYGHIRRNAKAGRYIVTARCGGGNLGVAAHVRVA